MITKLIFVGIHHTEGLPALCSSTRTGQIVDEIASSFNLEIIKSCLYPTDFVPDDPNYCMVEFIADHDPSELFVSMGLHVSNLIEPYFPNLVKLRAPEIAILEGDYYYDGYIYDAVNQINDLINKIGGDNA